MTPEEHRALGVELYNKTWELLEQRAAPDLIAGSHLAATFPSEGSIRPRRMVETASGCEVEGTPTGGSGSGANWTADLLKLPPPS